MGSSFSVFSRSSNVSGTVSASSNSASVNNGVPITMTPEIALVKKKLMHFPDFRNQSEEDLNSSARYLSDPNFFRNIYFDSTSGQRIWRVKILLSPVEISSVPRKIGRFIVPRVDCFPFGMLHTVLQIGPVIVEWGKESLVIPTPSAEFIKYKAVLAFDIDALNFDIQDNLIERACETICYWNTHYEYGLIGFNCQRFLREVLNSIGLTFKGLALSINT